MNKRELLQHALQSAALGVAATASLPARAQYAPASVHGTVILTVSGLIGKGNRGPLDPQLDQLMYKQQVKFASAHAFDFAAIAALPTQTLRPTLEYDGKQHTLKGPLMTDVLKACGAKIQPGQSYLLRAIDGYAVALPAQEAVQRKFILATHLDGHPLALGGLGPLWSVFEPDSFPDYANKSLKERFSLCPWGTYHIDVMAG